MSESVHPPTLLVFTLGAERERARRRLLGDRLATREVELHRACLDRALRAGEEAGCRVEVSSPATLDLPLAVARYGQSGDSFGERLRRAVRAAEGRAQGPLVVVGTDIPDLSSDLVRRATAQLERDPNALVVGPSPDGGFYLLAGRAPLEEVLGSIRWCSKHALDSLLQAAEEAGRAVVLLPALTDLDRRSDLESWVARTRMSGGPLRSLLRDFRQLLAALKRPDEHPSIDRLAMGFSTIDRGRAPPSLAQA